MPTPNDILRKFWGHDRLHPAQEIAVENVLNGKNVIALLPTGGGKSICFQVPAMLKEGICIVVSPLISLMQDQVQNLKTKGIKAMMLGGHIPAKELDRLLDNCIYGNYKFLYLSPERLKHELVQARIQQMNVNLIAIDEAHCISEWGHDFRPAYRDITILKELQPEVSFIALTATATKRVLKDISENLGLEDAEIVQQSFARDNISLIIKKCEDKQFELLNFFQKNDGVSIVYVRSRKMTLVLSEFLSGQNISARAYHGGLNSTQKEKLLKDWQAENFKIMVATTAFGMGIDKGNVRNVAHFHLPDSLENYYQEVGRAGRDGKESKAFLVYGKVDILNLKDRDLKNAPTRESVKKVYKKLNAYFSIAFGEGQETAYNFKFLDFCNTYNFSTYLVYNVLNLLDQLDVLSLSKEYGQRTELYFKIPNQQLYSFLEEHPRFQNLIRTMLRMQGGFFDYKTTVNMRLLQDKSGLNRNQINLLLKKLADLDVIDLTLADQDSTVVFLVPREDDATINPLVPHIEQHYKNKKNKVAHMIDFVENDETCKVIQLLSYFDEEKKQNCGKCSVCLKKKSKKIPTRSDLKTARENILKQLEQGDYTSKELVADLNFSKETILFVLKRMLDKSEINLTQQNTYSLRD